MSDLEFSVPEFNLLLALMHLRGTGNTGVFKPEFGFDKVENNMKKPLLEKGLISVDTSVLPYQYELTDAGWRAARNLLCEPAPAKLTQRTARVLWPVIRDFAAHMDRTGLELADIYPVEPEEEPAPETLGERIVAAFRELAGDDPDWVPLLALRGRLDGEDRAEVDKALTELHAAREIELIPESNQTSLTDADREAAIWLGGEYRHLIGIEVR